MWTVVEVKMDFSTIAVPLFQSNQMARENGILYDWKSGIIQPHTPLYPNIEVNSICGWGMCVDMVLFCYHTSY